MRPDSESSIRLPLLTLLLLALAFLPLATLAESVEVPDQNRAAECALSLSQFDSQLEDFLPAPEPRLCNYDDRCLGCTTELADCTCQCDLVLGDCENGCSTPSCFFACEIEGGKCHTDCYYDPQI